jgi:hypothetical protein
MYPTPTAESYGSSQNGVNGRGGENERPSAGTPSLEAWSKTWSPTGAAMGDLESLPYADEDPDPSDPNYWAKAPIRESDGTLWPTPSVKGNDNVEGRWEKSGDGLATRARLWSTPLASDSEQRGSFGRGNETLSLRGKNWPTPCTRDGQHNEGFEGQLPNAASLWPTPTASEATGYMSGSNRDTWRPSLKSAALGARPELGIGRPDPTTEKDGGPTSSDIRVLNPRFVEALMGWPTGWTSCEC